MESSLSLPEQADLSRSMARIIDGEVKQLPTSTWGIFWITSTSVESD